MTEKGKLPPIVERTLQRDEQSRKKFPVPPMTSDQNKVRHPPDSRTSNQQVTIDAIADLAEIRNLHDQGAKDKNILTAVRALATIPLRVVIMTEIVPMMIDVEDETIGQVAQDADVTLHQMMTDPAMEIPLQKKTIPRMLRQVTGIII